MVGAFDDTINIKSKSSNLPMLTQKELTNQKHSIFPTNANPHCDTSCVTFDA